VPTLVVGGEQTPTYFSSVNKAVVRCIAGSRLVIVPRANHIMSYQNPEAFNEALLRFLENSAPR
jgi:pimeloyl-ACP methyl ester carboxylesterase